MDGYSANRCKGGDPIDMVTGSYAFDQCDMIVNDILQMYPVERTYESLLASEDSPIGRGWTLSLFSQAIQPAGRRGKYRKGNPSQCLGGKETGRRGDCLFL